MAVRHTSLDRFFCANFASFSKPTFLVAAAMFACSATSARAQLTLTQAGRDRFGPNGLTTFATDFPFSGSNVGPEGMGFAPDGSVWVASTVTGNVHRFDRNANNQSALSAPVLGNYGAVNDIQFLGNTPYMTQFTSARVVELSSSGAPPINRVVATGIAGALGMAPNPFTGHIFVSSPTRIVDLNPATGVFTNFATGNDVDGITLSPDGSTLYAAVRGSGPLANRLIGYSTSSPGTITFNSGILTGGMDGTVLGYGRFAGFIYANMNNGTVIEINLNDPTQRVIVAEGGTRGDFAFSDPSRNGDMFITQRDRIMRLSGIPAPSSIALLGLGWLMAAHRRR